MPTITAIDDLDILEDDDLELMQQLAAYDARHDFWSFRQYMHPEMKLGWWQKHFAERLQNFFERMLDGERPKLVATAPPQHGKLCCDFTAIMSCNGWTTHGQLKKGDRVLHPSGRFVKVLAVSDKAPARMRVELTNGEVIWCHERHEWTVIDKAKRRRGEIIFTLETQDIMRLGMMANGKAGQRGSRYRWALPPVEPIAGSYAVLPVAPYAMGAWLGNGRRGTSRISQDSNDLEVVRAIADDCGYAISSQKSYPNGNGTLVHTAFAGEMSAGLRLLGFGALDCDKFIHDCYLLAPLRDRLELLAGLIDTDGYVYQKNGRVVYVTTDKRLMETFCELLSTFGWHASVDRTPPKLSSGGIQGRKNCYYIGFSPTLYIPCRLPRKQMQRVFTKQKPVAIKSIKRVAGSKRLGHCITVDAPDGLYLVGRTMQPTHNSESVKDFIAWAIGKDPALGVVFASYSEDLGKAANTYLQRMMASPRYQRTFPRVKLPIIGLGHNEMRYKRNSELLEFVGQTGSFRNTTVGGQINGFGLSLGVIDDPIKGRKEAQSKQVRNSTWSWLTDDFFLRFTENAGLLMIVTRWHIDDPIGRWLQKFPETELLSYAAIAETDRHGTSDWSVQQDYREIGEALFPEHKSLDFLNERKKAMTQASWQAQYQQRPFVSGGGVLPIEKLRIIPGWSAKDPDIVASVRYWDKAGTVSDEASYTAGVLMHKMRDGRFVISHVVHGKWLAIDREKKIKFWAETDSRLYGANYQIVVEQEPGSGGKESAENTVRMLFGYRVSVDKVTGAKEIRADPFAAQVQGGNVWLVAGDWVVDYIEEAEVWPQGRKDQIDASSGAFNKLVAKPSLNWDWVDKDRS